MTNPSPASEKFHGSTSISITVKDIQKSTDWYQNVVGFGIDRTFERDGRVQQQDQDEHVRGREARGHDRVHEHPEVAHRCDKVY